MVGGSVGNWKVVGGSVGRWSVVLIKPISKTTQNLKAARMISSISFSFIV